MRNIINIDYTTPTCWGTFNSASSSNSLTMKIRIDDGSVSDQSTSFDVITSSGTSKRIVLTPEKGLVTYDVPIEDITTKGVYKIKLADASIYTEINITETIKSGYDFKANLVKNSDKLGFEMIVTNPIDSVIAKVYPIGTVYESTNENFDPNLEWGGEWTKIEGRFLLGSSSSYPLGGVGGIASNTLVAGNIPQLTSASTTTSTKSLTGAFGNFAAQSSGQGPSASGICSTYLDGDYGGYGTSKAGMKDAIKINASHNHTVTVKVGSTSPSSITNMPPYKVINIWERTA